jgi:hypothetical protein
MTALNFPRSFAVRYEIAAHECQTIGLPQKSLKLRIAGSGRETWAPAQTFRRWRQRRQIQAHWRKYDAFDIYSIQSAADPEPGDVVEILKLAAWFSRPLAPPINEDVLPCRPIATKSPSSTERAAMAHNFAINDDVHHQLQGPQGRAVIKQPSVYTIVTCLPIEADGRPRYRIKSKTENIERVVTEEQISRLS